MNKVEIFKEVNEDIENIDLLSDVINYALKKEGLNNCLLNIIIVDNDYIQNINKQYRNKDMPTDVISFALEDDDTVKLPGDFRVLGDIYISIDKVKSQAADYGHSEKRELCFLGVHGFYHLLGYDHQTEEEEKIMFGKQEEVLEKYEIKR